MDLLKAIQTESLEKIKALVASKSIPVNTKWLDYAMLNSAIECGRIDVAMFLLEKKCRVNKISKSSKPDNPLNTPLHNAVKLEDLDLIRSLLDKKASIVAVNPDGDTPLHIAFMTRQERIVDALLEYIESTSNYTNVPNNQGLTHLHIACARNNGGVVEKFVDSGADLNDAIDAKSAYWPGYTALHFAVYFESLEVVTILKKASSCNSNAQDCNGQNPLKLAYDKLKNTSAIVHTLSTEEIDNTHLSYFHLACLRDDPTTLEIFIKNGVDVNLPISSASVFCPRYTPLHFAVESNCKKNVELLLGKGADINARNSADMTPLHLALYNEDHKQKDTIVDLLYNATPNLDADCADVNNLSYFHVAVTRNDLRLVKKFLAKDVDVNDPILYNIRKFAHFTPLHFAVLYGHEEMTDLLVKRGCNFNREDCGYHGTPLHMAVAGGHRGIIDLLLEKGVRLNKLRVFDDRTPLHLLVEFCVNHNGEEDVWALEYIERLANGCDVNAKDVDGNTALHLACSKLYSAGECARLLLEVGADIDVENKQGKTPFGVSFYLGSEVDVEYYEMLYVHVQKLKALGLKVNPKNEICCEDLLKDGQRVIDAEEVMRIQRQIQDEMAKLKGMKLNQRISLLDFLMFEVKRAVQYVGNEVVIGTIESEDLDEQYPLYGYLLKLQYRRSIELIEGQNRATKVDVNSNRRANNNKRRRC